MFLRLASRAEPATRSLLPSTRWPRLNRHALEQLLAIARTDLHVLIIGANEVDNSSCARIVHAQSSRASAPLVSVDCSELASRGWEGSLFGQLEMPAGATQPAIGDFLAVADGGTLFLDQVHALSLSSQLKLLRFLEKRQYRRLAETVVRHADVRVIGATGTDLSAAVQAGTFRQDLLAKLQVVSISAASVWSRMLDSVRSIETWLHGRPLRKLKAAG